MARAATQGDFFDRARRVVALVLMVAGGASVIGSALDWVTITARPSLVGNFDFGAENRHVEEPEPSEPFDGLEATYGYYSLAGGAVILAAAALLAWRAQGRYAWLAFIASIVVGAIAIAAYRGIADPASPLSHKMDVIGKAEPALGLTLVTAGAIVGLLAAATGIAATPRRATEPADLDTPA